MLVDYAADGATHHLESDLDVGDWRFPKAAKTGNVSPLFMPRWASRLTLTVTDVRVQRLRDISEGDAIAEGCRPFFDEDNPRPMRCPNGGTMDMAPLKGPLDDFQRLWNSINGPDAWDAAPWVAAYTFTVHRCNIDELEAHYG
ncbi:hypothetical protein [Thalassovita sp.]|uniref:hypothetical protein n=1 Tax=Thalassovita sp. TaxID=1979401 RepID=UPI002880DE61|nr:hypothetical protein [Thalassovita sp.]MDF1801701.1 hypothetical protein [Thalassovita sp.]